MTPEGLLDSFVDVAAAVRAALTPIDAVTRRERTNVRGQYALDLVADDAALTVLRKLPVRVVSEESGVHEHAGATITVVLDPVDGSTNCSRGISYWAISLCALDGDGPLAALVVNQATGERTTAIRDGGAHRDGVELRASNVTRVDDAVVALGGFPATKLAWKQFRALGCASLALCDVAAGGIDGYLDGGPYHAPWDYLGGYLACIEAGAVVRAANGDVLVTDDPKARRQVVAAATASLADALMEAT
ncbi:MAG: monophosphatase [Actinomycetota bacterium]|jgi:fructose-1,6-bisphosphatase/inositol monophosphatase family enzyme|nr:monophosphatase [Actinomycetota bacterium]